MPAYRRLSNFGFTLIELLITISLAAILLALAIPNFSSTIRNTRLTTSANSLVASLNLARSEAVKRGQEVVVRRTNTNWEGGWEVFVDFDRTPASDQNVFNDDGDTNLCEANEDCKLKVFPALPTNFTLRGGNNLADFIRYTPTGISNYIPDEQSNIANDYFVICDNSDNDATPQAETSRLIVVNSVGRPRLAEDVNHDGIPNLTSSSSSNVTTCSP